MLGLLQVKSVKGAVEMLNREFGAKMKIQPSDRPLSQAFPHDVGTDSGNTGPRPPLRNVYERSFWFPPVTASPITSTPAGLEHKRIYTAFDGADGMASLELPLVPSKI